ncbi:MAG: potassium channel protein [Gemmatimonadetes bacterium]|nr:MAG: potassium channel protein [Gemmatimonadota bacterium]
MQVFVRRFAAAAVLFAVLVVVGTLGYLWIEGWSFHDALYMTVITLTAVGYQEVAPLSEAGRNFTMALLGLGVTSMGIWFALITSFIVELDLKDALRRRRMQRRIEDLSDHIIVCGAGRTGRQVMEELVAMAQPFVAIERDHGRLDVVQRTFPDLLYVEGDATLDVNLEAAGVRRARGLVTCLSAEPDNVFVCLSARDLNQHMTIVARAFEEDTIDKLYRAGADHVVSPNVSGALRMASMLLRPQVVHFLDIATRSQGLSLRLEQAQITADSNIAGKTLAEAALPQATGLIVIAIQKERDDDERFVFNPQGTTVLEPGDRIIVLGQPEQIRSLQRFVGG